MINEITVLEDMTMAMNFKVYEDSNKVADYTADLIRKQVHNNPESVLLLESASSLNATYSELVNEVKKYPANLTQINLVMANNRGSLESIEALNVPKDNFYKSGKQSDLDTIFESIEKKRKRIINLAVLEMKDDHSFGFENGENEQIFNGKEIVVVAIGKDKAKAVEALYQSQDNSDKNFAKLKDHAMVTLVMDKDAASELDSDIVDYYTYKFA